MSHDPMRFISDRSRPFYMSRTELSIFVPFADAPRDSSMFAPPPLT